MDKVAEITTVDAEDIKRVAHIIGTERPIGWAWGLAFDQNKNGVQLSQSFIILAAMDLPLVLRRHFSASGAWSSAAL